MANDVILTSTILAHFLVMLVHYVSTRRRTMAKLVNICLFRSIIRAHQNAQETLMNFLFTSMNLSFLTDLLGYMVIQIIYKQLLTHIYTDIKRELQGEKHIHDSRALYAPLRILNIATKYNYSL